MIPAIALETGTPTAMDTITTAAETAISFMTKAFTAMTGNAYLVVFLGATMIGVGVSIFRKLRRGT